MRFEAADESHRVTPLELFFDLVFVYALTQVTALLANDTTWLGVARGVVVLGMLWFAWCSYAWLGNQVKASLGLLAAVLVMLIGYESTALAEARHAVRHAEGPH